MASETFAYDRAELRRVLGAFKAMDEEAIDRAKTESNALATYAANEIKVAALEIGRAHV